MQIQSSSPTLAPMLHVRNPRTLELEGKCSDDHQAPSTFLHSLTLPLSLSSYRNNPLASLIPHISPKPHIASWLEKHPPQLANKPTIPPQLTTHPENPPPHKNPRRPRRVPRPGRPRPARRGRKGRISRCDPRLGQCTTMSETSGRFAEICLPHMHSVFWNSLVFSVLPPSSPNRL